MSSYSYPRTATDRYLQQTGVPVVLDDPSVDATTDDIETRPPTAEGVAERRSKFSSSTVTDKPSMEPTQPALNADAADVAAPALPPQPPQPIPSHDERTGNVGNDQGGAAKTPPRHVQPEAAAHRPSVSVSTDIPSLTVVGTTPVSAAAAAPESFHRLQEVQEDRLPPTAAATATGTGRSTPVNERDRRQSRRRSVMDVRLFWFNRIGGFEGTFDC
jgi:hypothetical protein